MSKAFTRESDDAGGDDLAPVRPQSSTGAKNYITQEGAGRLRQRMDELLEERRALVSESGNADLNSNSDLRRIKSAIQRLQRILDSVIVAELPADQTKVGFAASVRVRDENGDEDTYQIVGIVEADPEQGRISANSPLARALLNQQAGATVSFQSPAGLKQLTVLKVHY